MVRSRMDWKYALRLAFPGLSFHALVFAKLHKRLVAEEEEQVLLDAILEHEHKYEQFLRNLRRKDLEPWSIDMTVSRFPPAAVPSRTSRVLLMASSQPAAVLPPIHLWARPSGSVTA